MPLIFPFFSFLIDLAYSCGCYWAIGPPILNSTGIPYPACPPSDICQTNQAINYQQNQSVYISKYSPSCPLECDSIQYDTRISSQNYPSKEQYDLFKQDAIIYNYHTSQGLNMTTYSEYKKYYFKINVFYESMDYTYVILSPKITLVDLLSNLGGSIGVLLGFSLFTFFEAIEILLNVIYILIFHW